MILFRMKNKFVGIIFPDKSFKQNKKWIDYIKFNYNVI